MPATGRRELDEGYPELGIEELAAVYRVMKAMEGILMGRGPANRECPGLMQDCDRVHEALVRIKFLTPEDDR